MSQATTGNDPALSAGQMRKPMAIVITCFLVVLLDGLDTISITFVAPVLAGIWGIPPSAMAPAFLATSVGAVVGYIVAGPMALRFGERKVMFWSTVLFGVGTLTTALATGIVNLTLIRLVTSIGLGAVLPLAVGTASSIVSPRRRTATAIFVATGLSAGGVLAGVLGGILMKNFGWASVFILGGVLPLLLLPAVLIFIPVRVASASPATSGNPVKALFGNGLALQTILLWLFAFLIFVVAYALLFWIPTIFTSWGMPKEMAPASAAVFSLGGLAGGILLIFFVAGIGVTRSLLVYSLFAMACILAFGLALFPQTMMMPLVFCIGAGLIPCCVGQSALAVAFYPGNLRATGVGCAAAAGRVGSIVGPAFGGLVVAAGWTPEKIFLAALIPAICALIVLIAAHIVVRPAEIAAAQATRG